MNFSFPRVKKEGMIKLTAWKGILEVVVQLYKIVSHWRDNSHVSFSLAKG